MIFEIKIQTHQILNALAHGSKQNFDEFIHDLLSVYKSIYGHSYASNRCESNPAPGMISGGGDGIDITKVEWK